MSHEVPAAILDAASRFAIETPAAKVADAMADLVVQHGYDLARCERCLCEASLEFFGTTLFENPVEYQASYQRRVTNCFIWAHAIRGLRSRAAEKARAEE